MANFCENKLEISGPKQKQKEFADLVKGDESNLDFKKIDPNIESRLFERDGKKFLSLSSAARQAFDVTKENGAYYFNTKWSPPEEIVQKASKMFPDLEFTLTYGEPNMDFAGVLACKDGKVLRHDETTYRKRKKKRKARAR